MATLAVLYWHVHLSHLALRAILLPMVGALTFAVLLRAYRTNHFRYWVSGGLLIGLLSYTYLSARLWVAYALLMVGWWLLHEKDKRRGALVSLLIAAALGFPLLLYTLNNPRLALDRVSDVAVLDWQGISGNLWLWVRAWFHEGHLATIVLNLPGRPILDLPLVVIFVVGLIGLVLMVQRQLKLVLWIVGLAVLAVIPSVISDNAPHPLRAIGLVIPIAIVSGMGARIIEERASFLGRNAAVVPLALFCWAGLNSARDFRAVLEHSELFLQTEMHINDGASFAAENVPIDMPVYFSPFSAFHPLPRFLEASLAPRPVGAFVAHECMVVSDVPAAYFSLTMFYPAFEDELSQWADTEVIFQEASEVEPRYAMFRAVPRGVFLAAWEDDESVFFADRLEVRFARPPLDMVGAGDRVDFTFALRPLQEMSQFYTIFVHLQTEPNPYEGGPLLSGMDRPLCQSHPTPVWEMYESIIQTIQLPIPETVEPGIYAISIGFYDSLSGQRLQVTEPAGQAEFFEIHHIEVMGTDS